MSKIILSTALLIGFSFINSSSSKACPCNSIDIDDTSNSWLKSNKSVSQADKESSIDEVN